MKHIPRAEVTSIKEVLYPLRKKKDLVWDKKNLEDLKELQQKINRLKDEKQSMLDNKPEPFKLKQFKNVPSKFMDVNDWVQKNQNLANKHKKDNIYIKNSNDRGHSNNKVLKSLNTSATIRKLPKLVKNKSDNKNIQKAVSTNVLNGIIDLNYDNKPINNKLNISHINTNTNTITNNLNSVDKEEFNIEKELENVNIENDKSPPLFEQPISNSEEIEKLIENYKQKYGDTEVIKSLLDEYETLKQKRKENQEMEKEIQMNENKIINEDRKNNVSNANLNTQNVNNTYDTLKNYEPTTVNDEKKPPIPGVDDAPLILPKIYKNYVKENIQLVTDNKIPKKVYEDNSALPENKHKNFGKVPEYIKRYEMERELKEQEMLKKKEELKYPKGTRLLSEEERVETLNSLIKTQQEITQLLEKMPITNRTLSIQRRKEEFIKKLTEIDKAIDMFSKKRVFVKK